MESDWPVVGHLKPHYKKLLALATCTATVYCIKKLMDKKKQKDEESSQKEKKIIKDFPSVEQIQQFIEELPFDAVNCNPDVTLKSLLGELSEFSEDEEWKELIASVHSVCDEDLPSEDTSNDVLTDEVLSIGEDEHVLTFRSVYEPAESAGDLENEDIFSDDDDDDADYGSTSSKSNNNKAGEGDVEKEDFCNVANGKDKEGKNIVGNPAGDAEGHVKFTSEKNK